MYKAKVIFLNRFGVILIVRMKGRSIKDIMNKIKKEGIKVSKIISLLINKVMI